jgi:nucleoside-triphosphatase THEP1
MTPASSVLQAPPGIYAGRVEPRRFRPRLSLGYYQALVATVSDLQGRDFTGRIECIRASIDTAEAHRLQLGGFGVAADDLQPTVYYLATLRLLRDLLLQGWTASTDDDGIFILPPLLTAAGEDPSDTKTELRDSFKFVLADQLLSDSVTTFIARMEKQGVAALFADGPELAKRLTCPGKSGDVGDAIRPVLQLISVDERDIETGLKLQDIWRYARLQWSIPYQQTPGRNLHYLIRDAAGPGQPVIGIAALGNAILGLSQRDDALGWSSAALARRLRSAPNAERRKLARHLVDFMRAERERVYSADLGIRRLRPETAVARLTEIEHLADSARRADLRRAGDERTAEYNLIRDAHDLVEHGRADDVRWKAVAKTQLYRRKRAANLADTIRTLAVYEDAGIYEHPERFLDLIHTEDGRRAVDTTLRRIKQQAVAENVMEIITCGAVAPYNQILGGKLVAMLMASPQVVGDVKERYDGKVSLIASGMAGRAIRRQPALSLLTTSSLYAVGSAQYNRVRIPGDLVEGAGEIRYERVGTTDSFGTVQFASDTIESLVAVARLANSKQRIVNNLFGEGMSPKLRSLRMGLDGLGLRPEEYLRHHSPRLLYAVPLASNALDILLGLTRRPKYILPARGGASTTDEIAAYWYDRWAKARLARPDALTRLGESRRDEHLLSRVASDLGASAYATYCSAEPIAVADLRVQNSDGPISFVEKLYRNANSYADRLTLEELDWIHVDLSLDGYLLDCATKGRQVVITGNPGDGKTFVLERLREALASTHNAVVITDANACSDDEILSSWRSCDANGRAFILAINEWPLFELRRLARTERFDPVEEAVRQVRSAVYFGDPPAPPQGRVVVIDLNLRNVLAQRVVIAALDRLTDDRFVSELADADPARANVDRLRTERVTERLAALLEQASRRGEHTTMRQLMGFLAYVITGGTDSTGRIMSQGDGRFLFANLVFEGGVGPFFDLVRRTFDPAFITHPDIDEDLWRGTTDPNEWLDPNDVPPAPAACAEEERERCFRVAKRRFYFEHRRGDDLLRLLPSDEADFDRVLREGLQGDPQLVREIVLAVNRFFEPDCSQDEDDRVTLWQSHRYDVRAPTAFVALYSQPADQISANGPKLAEWVEAWLPADMKRVGQFSLTAANSSGDPTRLLIDREVYLTLREAAVGLGRSTWSRSVARKVTRFVDELHRHFHDPRPLSDLEIRNVDTNLRAKVQVRREPRKYEL